MGQFVADQIYCNVCETPKDPWLFTPTEVTKAEAFHTCRDCQSKKRKRKEPSTAHRGDNWRSGGRLSLPGTK